MLPTFFYRTVLLVGIAILSVNLAAQSCQVPNRYWDRVFQSTSVTELTYGQAEELTTIYIGENVTNMVDQKLDLYQPNGDTLQKRPLIVMAFSGAFIFGAKDDEDVSAFCDTFAHKGYVTASIQYRKGLNLLNGGSAERAVYRATQDYSAAVRYLKANADQFGIDTNNIFIGGVSAGSFAALHLAYADESQRPQSTYTNALNTWPDLDCINCSGNNVQLSSDNIKGVINCWGAIGDTSWMDPDESVPMISFHGDADLIVPFNAGFPFTALFTMPTVYGSASIHRRKQSLGHPSQFNIFAGEGHNVWGPVDQNGDFLIGPNQYWQMIIDSTRNFLYEIIRPEPQIINADSVACAGDTITLSALFNPGSTYCWELSGGTILGNSTVSSIDVVWQTEGVKQIYLTEINVNGIATEAPSVSVNILAIPQTSLPENVSICERDSIELIASGGVDYSWSPVDFLQSSTSGSTTAYPEITTDYSVLITGINGCQIVDEVTVEVYEMPDSLPLVLLGDSLVTFHQGAVRWSYNGVVIQGTNNPFLILGAAGIYEAILISDDGCELRLAPFEYIPTGFETHSDLNIAVYPNPVNQNFFIHSGKMNTTLRITNIEGKLVHQVRFDRSTVIDTQAWSSGVYMYQLITQKETASGKIIKH